MPRSIARPSPRLLVGGAIAAISLANGALEPTFGARLDDARDLLSLGVGATGLALGAFSVGLLPGAAVTALVAHRLHTRVWLTAGAVLSFGPLLVLGALLLAGSPPDVVRLALAPLWGVAGFGVGMLDTTHAAEAAVYARPGARLHILLFLAVRGVGAVAAALVGAWAIASATSVAAHWAAVGAVTLALAVPACLVLPDIRGAQPAPAADDAVVEVGVLGLARLGVLAAASVIPTGATYYWATSVLAELRAPAVLIGSGLVGYTVAQVASLGVAWWTSARVAPLRLARVGLALALVGAGLLGAVAVDPVRSWLPAGGAVALVVVALVLVGLGLAPLPVLALQAASHVRAGALALTTRVASVVTLQCACTALAPLLLAALAGATSITAALALVTAGSVLALPAGLSLLAHARRS